MEIYVTTEALAEALPGIPPPSRMASPNPPTELRVAWPARLVHQQSVGFLRDFTGNSYPRDIGRSTKFSNGRIIFQFGDTFSHSKDGTFLGNTDNTASFLDQTKNPTLSTYRHAINDTQGEKLIRPFLIKLPSEGDTNTTTIKLWSFSGIVEYKVTPSAIRGWTLYQKRELKKAGDIDGKYLHTGIADVISNFRTGEVRADRVIPDGMFNDPPPLFTASEPLFGDLCAVSDATEDDEGDEMRFIYAYGHLRNNRKDIGVARAPLQKADIKSEYRYWSGKYWSDDIRKTAHVMTDMQHGQIFRTTMFGERSAYKWAFIGNNAFGDSKAVIGRAKRPEGPWEVSELNMKAYNLNDNAGDFRYCFYPHTWAFDIKERGDMMITWSEGGLTGNVVAELVRFETTTEPVPENEMQW